MLHRIVDKKVFPNKKAFDDRYDQFLEEQPSAPAGVTKAYRKIFDDIEDYLGKVGEWDFQLAYIMGYNAAMEDLKKANANAQKCSD